MKNKLILFSTSVYIIFTTTTGCSQKAVYSTLADTVKLNSEHAEVSKAVAELSNELSETQSKLTSYDAKAVNAKNDADDALDESLLDTISHDIKTPLAGLMLSIERLKSVPPQNASEYKALISIVENGTRKIRKVIGELTDTRKQEHKYQASEELLSFEHILEDVRLTLSTDISESGTIFKKDIGISELGFSRRKLRSILYNLVNNAIKFKHPERTPEIEIKTYAENEFIVVSIKDNGIGIEKDKYEQVFSKYFRMKNATEGSGIGLYLVKEIVTSAGGRIELDSEVGKGSEFKVYLKR